MCMHRFITLFHPIQEIGPFSLFQNLELGKASTDDNCHFATSWVKSCQYEPRHDKTNKMVVRPAKTQISLGIRPVWSESSLIAWRKLGSLTSHWVPSKDSDQTGRMSKLFWVFAERTLILLVLSCRGPYQCACISFLHYYTIPSNSRARAIFTFSEFGTQQSLDRW